MPAKAVTESESLLRSYYVQPKPRELPSLKLGNRRICWCLARHSRRKQKSWFTGDQEMLDLDEKPQGSANCRPSGSYTSSLSIFGTVTLVRDLPTSRMN